MSKVIGFRMRIDRRLRKRFLEVCRNEDKLAAQVPREFMRKYIVENAKANGKPGGCKRSGQGEAQSEAR